MRHAVITTIAAALIAALVFVGVEHGSQRADATAHSAVSVARTMSTTAPVASTSVTTASTNGSADGNDENATVSTVSAEYDENFPDPFVLTTPDGYVAFSTNSGGANVPVLTSSDLTHWTDGGDALPDLPSWARESGTWAPSVIEINGSFVMYVTLFDTRTPNECIFTAVATSATGPYTLTSFDPLVCALHGSIDASVMRTSDGRFWLVWKDEAHEGQPATIMGASLRDDGLSIEGTATALVSATEGWELDNVEGPSMIREGDHYVLFFSTGSWRSSGYSTGYAICSSPLGPCTVHDGAWLSSADGLDGPGGLQAFTGRDGVVYVAFHTWRSCTDCEEWKRVLNIRMLDPSAATPRLA